MGTDRPDDNCTEALAALGLPADATRDDLRRAFRRRARALHPDAGGDAAAFRGLKDAYDQARLRCPAVPPPHLDPYRTWLSELDRCAAMTVPAPSAVRRTHTRRRSPGADRFDACLEAALREVG